MRSVLLALKNRNDICLKIVTIGASNLFRFGNTNQDILDDGFEIAHKLLTNVEGDIPAAMAQTVGLGVIQITPVLVEEKPDIVMIGCDRCEIFAAAIAASLNHNIIAHLQGGELSSSIDENIRHATTKLSHIHFPATEKSKQRIERMGENSDNVFNFGCPFMDHILSIELNKNKKEFLQKEFPNLFSEKPFGIIIQHSVTNEYHQAYTQMVATLKALQDVGIQCLLVWPNPDSGSEEISRAVREHNLHYGRDSIIVEAWRTIAADKYLNLLYHSDFLVGNSSSGIREAFAYGIPVINVGSRQNGRERTKNIIDVGYNQKLISDAIISVVGKRIYDNNLYGDGSAGQKIADKLATINLSGLLEKSFHS